MGRAIKMAAVTGISDSVENKKFQGFDIWKVRQAADTLTEAEIIKADKKFFNAASKYISQRIIAERQAKLDAAKKAAKPA